MLKMTSKKLCKSCGILITQIELFASHYQIKYCDTHFKSITVDHLKNYIPQPKSAIQLIYTTPNYSNCHQRSRTNS